MNRHRIARRARRIGEAGVIYLLTWQDLREQVRRTLQLENVTQGEAAARVARLHPAWRQRRHRPPATDGAAYAVSRLADRSGSIEQ